jgi:mycofactocin system glycosyltransferase
MGIILMRIIMITTTLTVPAAISDNSSAAYRLRKGVRCCLHSDDKPMLILDFPLRAVAVQPCWRPLLEHMTTADFVSVQALNAWVPEMLRDKTESFLEQLVRKALCECRGVPGLSSYPMVSIVIPVRNRQKDLAHCLRSLCNLLYPAHRLEIIVVDDASSDGTLQVVAKFPVKTLAVKKRRQAPGCRNLAARQASGEILAFIDSDCVADPSWLNDLLPAFRDPAVGAVGGLVDAYFDDKGLDRYEKVKSSLQVSTWHKRSSKKERHFYVPSCNLLIRREFFRELGGFRDDLHVGEDVDLCWRLQRLGKIVEYKPVGKVYHKHRNHMWPFCKRRFQYGTSEPVLQQLHPDRAKQFMLPLPEFSFWFFMAASAWFSCPPLLGASAAALIFQIRRRILGAGCSNIPISQMAIAGAVIRTALALFYHLCLFVSRYYLVACILLWPLSPRLGAGALSMHVLAGIVQFHTRRPRLNLLSFLAFFSLDQISYQLGVWWGCCRRMFFEPLLPRPVFSLTASGSTRRKRGD